MKRVRFLPSILLAASLLLAPQVQSAGLIIIDPTPGMPRMPAVMPIVHPPGHRTPDPSTTILRGAVSYGLRLKSADVKVEIADQVAKTYITQTFMNDTDANLAGTYLFPLPDDTTFSSFSLQIDGKPVEGKILEANEARQEYEAIVRRLVDPGLLEYADYKTVRARIFPIPAHGTKQVQLEYTQLLKAENGMLKYRFPLKTEGAGAAEEIKVNVKLASKQGLRTIWSPSHTISTNRDGEHLAKVAYFAKDTVPDKDFFLYYSVSDKDLDANLITNKNSGEDGYYLMTLTPPVESKVVTAKDIVLVADTSGSMEGERLKQAKEALKYLIGVLGEDDRFSIVQFNTDVDAFKTELVPATKANKALGTKFVDELEAHGGTNIGDALKTAVTLLDKGTKERPSYLVMMTDGEPTVGDTTIEGLVKKIDSTRDIRVFDFGVGYDINTRLLTKLAEAHHGTAQFVEPDESIETSLSNFYQKIKSPVLSDVKIAYDGVEVKDVYPREVKDLFAGSQILMLGRYKGAADATVKLTGTVNGVSKAYSFPLKFSAEETAHTYLPRLWAMRRIGHLTEVAQENGDNKEVVDEIIALSKKFGIITAYTSFLVTDPNEVNAHGTPIGAMPAWGGAGAGGIATNAPVPARMSAGRGGRALKGAVGAVGAPRDTNFFQVEPTVLDERYMRTGRAEGTAAGAHGASGAPAPIARAGAAFGAAVGGGGGMPTYNVATAGGGAFSASVPSARFDFAANTMMPPPPMPKLSAVNGKVVAHNEKKVREFHAQVKPGALPTTTLDSLASKAPNPALIYGFDGGSAAPSPAFSEPQNLSIIDDRAVVTDFRDRLAAAPTTGTSAVKLEKEQAQLKDGLVASQAGDAEGIKTVESKTFYMRGGVWIDSAFDEKTSPKVEEITFGTKEYFDLMKTPGISKFLSIGARVILVFNGHTYKIIPGPTT